MKKQMMVFLIVAAVLFAAVMGVLACLIQLPRPAMFIGAGCTALACAAGVVLHKLKKHD